MYACNLNSKVPYTDKLDLVTELNNFIKHTKFFNADNFIPEVTLWNLDHIPETMCPTLLSSVCL